MFFDAQEVPLTKSGLRSGWGATNAKKPFAHSFRIFRCIITGILDLVTNLWWSVACQMLTSNAHTVQNSRGDLRGMRQTPHCLVLMVSPLSQHQCAVCSIWCFERALLLTLSRCFALGWGAIGGSLLQCNKPKTHEILPPKSPPSVTSFTSSFPLFKLTCGTTEHRLTEEDTKSTTAPIYKSYHPEEIAEASEER